MNKTIYLSYILDKYTPSYGNRNQFLIEKKSDISTGDIANDSFISSTVHMGTHIDMPNHFYEEGQTIEDFDVGFWIFEKILFIDIKPTEQIIKNELIDALKDIEDIGYEILIVKTGICYDRLTDKFSKYNYGFDASLYDYIKEKFPNIRVFGFDSISVSSFQNRQEGRKAHKSFLNPESPILLLEDMDLTEVYSDIEFNKLIISPLRISKCDGLPCTVIGFTND